MNIPNAKRYKELIVWKEAKTLVLKIYGMVQKFPKEELYVLSYQMRKSALSVPSNIAEGNQRKSNKDKLHFFNIAHSSLTELDCQLEIAKDLSFISHMEYEECVNKINQTSYLLTRFIDSKSK